MIPRPAEAHASYIQAAQAGHVGYSYAGHAPQAECGGRVLGSVGPQQSWKLSSRLCATAHSLTALPLWGRHSRLLAALRRAAGPLRAPWETAVRSCGPAEVADSAASTPRRRARPATRPAWPAAAARRGAAAHAPASRDPTASAPVAASYAGMATATPAPAAPAAASAFAASHVTPQPATA
eukprot:scaffold72471_cov33-Phaeocystis_antarctica.AAC.1